MDKRRVYRHEDKYIISQTDKALLVSRLSAVLTKDPHSDENGGYSIRSIYFDDPLNTALSDSIGGVPYKVKYRIRMYGGNSDSIVLEKKVKNNGGGTKYRQKLTLAETEKILKGDYGFLLQKENALYKDFYSALSCGHRPANIIDYRRTAFFDSTETVRITTDEHIRANHAFRDFFKKDFNGTVLTEKNMCVLEVKYDAFLPDYIKKLIGIGNLYRCGFSKYSLGRKII